MTQDVEKEVRAARERIAAIRREIAAMELVSSGTLHTRTKTCGKANCRCAEDDGARHGPYREWNRREGGRLVHKSLSARQAEMAREAIECYREILGLLDRWERETVKIILAARDPKT